MTIMAKAIRVARTGMVVVAMVWVGGRGWEDSQSAVGNLSLRPWAPYEARQFGHCSAVGLPRCRLMLRHVQLLDGGHKRVSGAFLLVAQHLGFKDGVVRRLRLGGRGAGRRPWRAQALGECPHLHSSPILPPAHQSAIRAQPCSTPSRQRASSSLTQRSAIPCHLFLWCMGSTNGESTPDREDVVALGAQPSVISQGQGHGFRCTAAGVAAATTALCVLHRRFFPCLPSHPSNSTCFAPSSWPSSLLSSSRLTTYVSVGYRHKDKSTS